MNAAHIRTPRQSLSSRSAWPVVLATLFSLASAELAKAATTVTLWDAGRLLDQAIDGMDRTGWRTVPAETLALETDPLKAASDPGYYGREYAFGGDAVVENERLAAIFSAEKGRVTLYGRSAGGSWGAPFLEFLPGEGPAVGVKPMSRCEVVRNSGDEVVLKAVYGGDGHEGEWVIFSFGKDEMVEVKAAPELKKLRLMAPVEIGIVPSFVGDDLVFDLSKQASDSIWLPTEQVFVGLLSGETSQLVMTWPKGSQRLKLQLTGASGSRRVEAIEFEPGGQGFYVSALRAPGIWHREALKPAFLEKDVTLSWKRPFAARWKTQLVEAGVPTTFRFRDQKGQIWRGVPGSYQYPVWFDGSNALYHLSKKVPPKGESVIYFLEGQGTPAGIMTPVDVIKATLGREACEGILDVVGRKLRTHHRRAGEGVHRACTCGCTEAIQAVFESGEEVSQRAFVQEALGDMNYFVEQHVARIQEYVRFAADLSAFLKAQATAVPSLKPICERLETVLQQIPQEYSAQKENMKSAEHARDLTRQTMALTESKRTNNLAAYMKLLDAWRGMGGAQDYVVAQCHTIARKLFQEAGYACVNEPNTLPLVQEVRARCRQVLRHADGYEIWADY
ncbi:MAG: hypothetical protein U1G07_03220 [Verrucomicrobiota bacterium]